MTAIRHMHHRAVRRLATRSANVCVVIAIIMLAVAIAYCLLLLLYREAARGPLLLPWAAVEFLLSAWNLLVYVEKRRIRDGRRAGG